MSPVQRFPGRIVRKPYVFLARTFRSSVDATLAMVLPPTCQLCNQPVPTNQDFCGTCDRNLRLSEPTMLSACLRCGRPSPKVTPSDHGASPNFSSPCRQCKKEKLAFSAAIPLWSYQDRVCEAVVAAKYGHQSSLGGSLGVRLATS